MASVNTQFSIAVHIMAGIGAFPKELTTSEDLAGTVNAAPSFVRRVLAKLSKAGLVQTTQGKAGGCSLSRSAQKITLLEVYEAVEAPKAFAIHEYPEKRSCKVSCNIKPTLQSVLENTQRSLEDSLKKVTVADIIKKIG